MAINRCNYDFHLLREGWISVPPYDEGSSVPAPPPSTVATVRMVEYNSDDKPDIWFKSEIVYVNTNHNEVQTLLKKYGLPNAILVNCASEQAQMYDKLLEFDRKL